MGVAGSAQRHRVAYAPFEAVVGMLMEPKSIAENLAATHQAWLAHRRLLAEPRFNDLEWKRELGAALMDMIGSAHNWSHVADPAAPLAPYLAAVGRDLLSGTRAIRDEEFKRAESRWRSLQTSLEALRDEAGRLMGFDPRFLEVAGQADLFREAIE